MSKAFIDDTNLTAIANAIRAKNGSTDTYLPSAMPAAIEAIPTGVDTSDATATSDDIVINKTAYVNGNKITGSRSKLWSNTGTGNILSTPLNTATLRLRSAINGKYIDFVSTINKNFYANEGDTFTAAAFASDTGDAIASDVISGKTFTSESGLKIAGTMPSKDAATFTPSTTDQTIDSGQYLSGAQTIQGDANLIPENIASGVSIFGITGTHESNDGIDTSDATATAADIINGQTAYVNGTKITGTLVVQNYYTGTTTPESTTGSDGDLYFKVVR